MQCNVNRGGRECFCNLIFLQIPFSKLDSYAVCFSRFVFHNEKWVSSLSSRFISFQYNSIFYQHFYLWMYLSYFCYPHFIFFIDSICLFYLYIYFLIHLLLLFINFFSHTISDKKFSSYRITVIEFVCFIYSHEQKSH